jgi:3',5'-cyclic AMP phosphodiesterase CpdA
LPKHQRLSGGFNIRLLLTAWVVISFSFNAFNCTGGYFVRSASASSHQSNPHDQLHTFDHIILTWSGNPATSQAVTWRSSVDFKKSVAEIAPAQASSDFAKNAKQILAKTTFLKVDNKFVYYHSVNFTDLGSNTLYAYRVGNGDIWSEWFQFRTASRHAEPFTFLYFGDAQKNIFSLWSRTIRTAVLKAPGARFMIHAGDMVEHKNNDREWNEWFSAGGWIFATIPSLPVIGNHEYKIWKDTSRAISRFWRPQFTLPQYSISGLAETFYYLDYQGVRIVVLNSNRKIKQQAEWFENVLKHNPNHWTIVTFHHPVYSSTLSRNNKKLKKYWKPLFDKFGVDLVLQGHDHVYARGRSPGEVDGPVYVTSVSGPKMYKLDRAEWMDRAGENMQLFQVIAISRNILSYKSVTVTGKVYDAFDLIKKEDKDAQLIDRIPVEFVD